MNTIYLQMSQNCMSFEWVAPLTKIVFLKSAPHKQDTPLFNVDHPVQNQYKIWSSFQVTRFVH